jgi:hypothetical protein
MLATRRLRATPSRASRACLTPGLARDVTSIPDALEMAIVPKHIRTSVVTSM